MEKNKLKVVEEEVNIEEHKKNVLRATLYLREGLDLLEKTAGQLPTYHSFGELVKALGNNYELPCKRLVSEANLNSCLERMLPEGFPKAACVGCKKYDPGYQGGHPKKSALRDIADLVSGRINKEKGYFRLEIRSE